MFLLLFSLFSLSIVFYFDGEIEIPHNKDDNVITDQGSADQKVDVEESGIRVIWLQDEQIARSVTSGFASRVSSGYSHSAIPLFHSISSINRCHLHP